MSASARVSKGAESEQDAGTPPDVMLAIARRFGPVQFDLAAHAGNKKHAIYMAPKRLEIAYDPAKTPLVIIVAQLVRAGARLDESEAAAEQIRATGKKGRVSVPNHDPNPFARDSFAQDWSALSRRFPAPDGGPGLGYLNCEFSNIDPWAEKCAREARRGANTALLTPLSLGSNWWRDRCAGVADTYVMTGGKQGSGRITFVGSTTPYPKDTMVSHFHPGATGAVVLWDWRGDLTVCCWMTCARAAAASLAAARWEGTL